MAITASGMFVKTFQDVFDASQLPVDVVSDALKAALFTNSVTPNFSSDTAYAAAPYNANEVTGTGYTAGGVALTGKTFAESPTGTVTFDANDAAWAGATFSGARGVLIWDDTVATPTADPVIVLVNFGADFGVTSGTFTVQWSANGIFYFDLTP